MSRAATARLKVEAPLGMRPSLENRRISELGIDPTYQRSIENAASTALIRRIAMHWDWRLFHPLSVVRRDDGSFWVIDGQHRLAAARLRKDLYDLPCVVSPSTSVTDEAAAFVAMNQQRRPLRTVDVFRAAVAAGDPEHLQAMQLIEAAGLRVTSNGAVDRWKPNDFNQVGGVLTGIRTHGYYPVGLALNVLAKAWFGEALTYAGTILPGLIGAVAGIIDRGEKFDQDLMILVMGGQPQASWVREFTTHREVWNVSRLQARTEVIANAYAEASGDE